jgi:fatty acid desaturase
MQRETLSMTLLVCFSVIFWALGGILALYKIGKKQQKKTKKTFFEALLEDKDALPVPMYLGYTFVFLSSWLHILLPVLMKTLVIALWFLLYPITSTKLSHKKGTKDV